MKHEKEESAGDFLARVGTDAHKWAVEFNKMYQHAQLNGNDLDVINFLGWFANAIEAGRSAGYWRAREELGLIDW